MNKIQKIFIISGVILLRAIGTMLGGQWWYSANLKPAHPGAAAQLFRINDGDSSAAIAQHLADASLIRNPLAFRLYLRLHGSSGQLQAGLYQLNPRLNVPQLAQQLISGETAVAKLTIIPGMQLAEITDQLKQLGYQETAIRRALGETYPYSVLKDKPKHVSLEGYLFPDTYIVNVDTPVVKLIDLILSTTNHRVTPDIRHGWAAHGLNIHEGLTLASMVEAETSNPTDQRKVAQVFYKRLAMGMHLEADPTFAYGAALLGVTPRVDLDSPYNTYLHKGLPPTPITAPGLGAMQAVANPARTSYLYFIADKQGITHFAQDFEKHKQNIEKYLN